LKENYYTYPINSSILGVYKVSDIELEKVRVEISDVRSECVLLPDPPVPSEDGHRSFLCVPTLHTLVESGDEN